MGRADDPLEREADVTAKAVVGAPLQQPMCACGGTPGPDGECAGCRARRLGLQRRATDDAHGEAPAIVHEVLRSPGHPLDNATRSFMEMGFGSDFSRVRVHSDAQAAQSASEVNALAYASGRDLVFGAGQYVPGSIEGRRLIAHELAHTVQQGGAPSATIQRASDYTIRGVYPGASSHRNIIFFEIGKFTIPGSEHGKLAPLATPPARALTLTGYTSEEGSSASNTAIIDSRIAAVNSALGSAGHIGTRTPNPQPAAGEGQIDYRRMRAVEVVPTPAAGPPPTSQPQCQVTPANPHPEVTACGASFSTAHPQAATMVSTALAAVSVPTPAATAQLASLFPGVARATIQTGLTSLATQLALMTGQHECHNTCDAGCQRPAYNTGIGPASMMTLCPAFINGASAENALILIHEGLHATPGVAAEDIAYRQSRMINYLGTPQVNTDSWVLLILRTNPGASGGGPPTDPTSGMIASEETQARRALAHVEQWMLTAEFDTSILYEAIQRNVGRAGGWAVADHFHAGTQHVIHWLFGLTDPGPAAPFATPPTHDDQVNVAGIHDRYSRMRRAVWLRPITMTKAAVGPDAWASNLGNSVSLTQPFFTMIVYDEVLHLVRLMLRSMPDVPSARETAYVEGANQIRWHRGGVGP